MIEKIWIGKTRRRSRAEKLLQKIWTQSADHHPGQRLLERSHSKRPERRTHSITKHDRSKATCTKGGNQRRTMLPMQRRSARLPSVRRCGSCPVPL